MKKIYLTLALICSMLSLLNAQVAINTDGSSAGNNTMLDIKSTNKGMKFPRMTTAQRKAIPVTAEDAGLFVFDTDKQRLLMYDGHEWKALSMTSQNHQAWLTTIPAPEASVANNFGYGTAVDGDYAAVSGSDISEPNAGQGSVYIYKKANGVWELKARVFADDGHTGQNFGATIAINQNYLVVGAPATKLGGVNEQGAVYIYKRSGENWIKTQKISHPTAFTYQKFGASLALDNNNIIIGAPGESFNGGLNQGAAYIYTLTGETWTFAQRIIAADGANEDGFGTAVSIYANSIAISAPKDDIGTNVNCGSVHIYTKPGNTYLWNQRIYFPYNINHEMGSAVAVYTDHVAITMKVPGSSPTSVIRLYKRVSGNVWQEEQVIAPYNFDAPVEQPFGSQIFWKKGYLVATSPFEVVNGRNNAGVVYIYKFDAATVLFTPVKRVEDDDAAINNFFGKRLAFDGNNFIITSSSKELSFGAVED